MTENGKNLRIEPQLNHHFAIVVLIQLMVGKQWEDELIVVMGRRHKIQEQLTGVYKKNTSRIKKSKMEKETLSLLEMTMPNQKKEMTKYLKVIG